MREGNQHEKHRKQKSNVSEKQDHGEQPERKQETGACEKKKKKRGQSRSVREREEEEEEVEAGGGE